MGTGDRTTGCISTTKRIERAVPRNGTPNQLDHHLGPEPTLVPAIVVDELTETRSLFDADLGFIVSNQSRSYGYARANFGDFRSSTDNAAWYDRLQNRAGFVVVTELDDFEDAPDTTMYGQLQRGWGVDTHYRVVSAAEDGTKAYAIVPGRTVSGPATGESVPVSGTMTFGDRTRNVSTTVPVENGTYSVRLSTPGTYTVGNRTVVVTRNQTVTGS